MISPAHASIPPHLSSSRRLAAGDQLRAGCGAAAGSGPAGGHRRPAQEGRGESELEQPRSDNETCFVVGILITNE